MPRLSGIPVLLAACALATACTSNPRVQSNYSDSLNITDYKTFGFARATEVEDPDLAETLEMYFGGAIQQQLHWRGLERSDNPDLLVVVSADLEDVSRAPVTANICPSYEDYSSRKMYRTTESKRPMCLYSEGLVEVELVSARDNRTVLEGTSRVRLDENDRDEALLLSVMYDVATMFGGSPVRDGRPLVWSGDH